MLITAKLWPLLQISRGGGANDPNGWNWAPIRILPPNHPGVSAGDVLHIRGRIGHHVAGSSGASGLRRGFTGSTLASPFPFDNGPFEVTYTLTQADITAGLSISWNAWQPMNAELIAGTSQFIVGIDDMLIVFTPLDQAAADALLNTVKADINALIAGMLNDDGEFFAAVTVESLVAAVQSNLTAPVILESNTLALVNGTITGNINLSIDAENLASSVTVTPRVINVNNRVSGETPALGVTVTADANSPTGYIATFVYHNTAATAVSLNGEMLMRDYLDRTNTNRFTPHQFRPGLVPIGGSDAVFSTPMTNIGGGYWMVSLPLPGGGIPYWFTVTGGPATGRIPDPENPPPRALGHNARQNMSYEYSVVRMPWNSTLQHEINNRNLELPHNGPRGQIVSRRFESSIATVGGDPGMHNHAGNMFGYLLIYLPPGFDVNRDEPYPVVYMAHGWWNDNTDWFNGGGVPMIMDNLIGAGLIEPTVVVSINNSRHGLNFIAGANLTNSRNDLLNYVMPFAEEHFNVSNNPEQRALAGYSLSASWAAHVFTTNAADFAYFGIFSPPMGPSPVTLQNAPGGDLPTVVSGRGVFATYGFLDTLRNNLTQEVHNYEVPGAHDFHAWAQLFAIFARNYLW